MTFISVIDSLNRFKGNTGLRRSKIRDFDNKEKYLETYFAQKHTLGETHKEEISDSRKKVFIDKFRKDNQHELTIQLIKTAVTFIFAVVLICSMVLLFIRK
jgi:hypothetical protein